MNNDDKKVGFTSYQWNGKQLDPCDHLTDSLIYMIDTQKMIFPEWNPDRMVVKKRTWYQELKRRLSHAWYALKGGECD